jgi:hypothetical protein
MLLIIPLHLKMKRRRSENKTKAPFPLAEMLPEMQAEILTHLALQDLFGGTCLVSKTLHALTHKEVQRRLKHDVFRGLPLHELGSGSGWNEYDPSRFIFDEEWSKIRRNLVASVSWRSRCDWRRSSFQCDGIHTLWLAQATMIQDIFFRTAGHGVLRAFSPARHGLYLTSTRSQYWYLARGFSNSYLLVVSSPGMYREHRAVSDALRAVNSAHKKFSLAANDPGDVLLERLTKALDNLFHASFMELDLDLTLSYDGWQMGRSTLWRMAPEQGAKVGV